MMSLFITLHQFLILFSSQFEDIHIQQICQYGVDVYDDIEIQFHSHQTARIECALDRQKEKKMVIIGTKGRIECVPFYRPTQATVIINDESYIMNSLISMMIFIQRLKQFMMLSIIIGMNILK